MDVMIFERNKMDEFFKIHFISFSLQRDWNITVSVGKDMCPSGDERAFSARPLNFDSHLTLPDGDRKWERLM